MTIEKHKSKEKQIEDTEGNIKNQKPSAISLYADPG